MKPGLKNCGSAKSGEKQDYMGKADDGAMQKAVQEAVQESVAESSAAVADQRAGSEGGPAAAILLTSLSIA